MGILLKECFLSSSRILFLRPQRVFGHFVLEKRGIVRKPEDPLHYKGSFFHRIIKGSLAQEVMERAYMVGNFQIALIYLISCMKHGVGLLEILLYKQPTYHSQVLLKNTKICRNYDLDSVSSNAMKAATGRLLKKWHGHYRAVTCLVFSMDQSFLISGAEDGSVRVWSLLMMFDEERQQRSGIFMSIVLLSMLCRPVTDIVTGYGGSNAIIVSTSQDRTCKVWSLARGTLLRNIVFPSVIDAVTLDPGEHVFYAGGGDGKIYIVELNSLGKTNNNYGLHIIGTLSDQRKSR